jgi:hypothetical protein
MTAENFELESTEPGTVPAGVIAELRRCYREAKDYAGALADALRMIRTLLCLLLAGCATMPDRTIQVTWQGSCGVMQTKPIRFVDTRIPVLDCIRNAETGDAFAMSAMLLVGVPVAACALIVNDRATVYASLSAGSAEFWAYQALHTPEQLIEHEIDHHMGMVHPMLLPWLTECAR